MGNLETGGDKGRPSETTCAVRGVDGGERPRERVDLAGEGVHGRDPVSEHGAADDLRTHTPTEGHTPYRVLGEREDTPQRVGGVRHKNECKYKEVPPATQRPWEGHTPTPRPVDDHGPGTPATGRAHGRDSTRHLPTGRPATVPGNPAARTGGLRGGNRVLGNGSPHLVKKPTQNYRINVPHKVRGRLPGRPKPTADKWSEVRRVIKRHPYISTPTKRKESKSDFSLSSAESVGDTKGNGHLPADFTRVLLSSCSGREPRCRDGGFRPSPEPGTGRHSMWPGPRRSPSPQDLGASRPHTNRREGGHTDLRRSEPLLLL